MGSFDANCKNFEERTSFCYEMVLADINKAIELDPDNQDAASLLEQMMQN